MLLDRVIEHRAVRVRLTEIVRPGVDVGVEMHQREAAADPARQRTQQRQGDAVLAAQGNQMAKPRHLLLDQLQAGRYVAEGKPEIADVGDVQRRGFNPEFRMRAIGQHPAGSPDRVRAVARAGTVGGADVQRHASDDKLRARIAASDPKKPGSRGEGGNQRHRLRPYQGDDDLRQDQDDDQELHQLRPAGRSSRRTARSTCRG